MVGVGQKKEKSKMTSQMQTSNIIGALVSVTINTIMIFLFISRLRNIPKLEYYLGILLILNIFPLTYLLIQSLTNKRPAHYFIQISLMIAFLLLELILDYILKIEFRQNLKFVIPYIMLFFTATGGMLGVAKYAGKKWMWAASLTFLIMTALSFYQRHVTGK
jgi:hypothetical protein